MNGSCLVNCGFCLVIYGAITVIGNILGLVFTGDDMLSQSMTDSEGTEITMSLSYRTFLTATLLKCFFGLIIYYQGKWMRKLFKPILKE
jgi:hypothetical protein